MLCLVLARTATIKLVESPQETVRRGALPAPPGAPADLVLVRGDSRLPDVPLRSGVARADVPPHAVLRHASRTTLARALLADPAPFR